MEHLFLAVGMFGWGMVFQEWKEKRKAHKEKYRRIIIDAPFLPEQADAIMETLNVLQAAVSKSMDVSNDPKRGMEGR